MLHARAALSDCRRRGLLRRLLRRHRRLPLLGPHLRLVHLPHKDGVGGVRPVALRHATHTSHRTGGQQVGHEPMSVWYSKQGYPQRAGYTSPHSLCAPAQSPPPPPAPLPVPAPPHLLKCVAAGHCKLRGGAVEGEGGNGGGVPRHLVQPLLVLAIPEIDDAVAACSRATKVSAW